MRRDDDARGRHLSGLRYRELAPEHGLRRQIECYWFLRGNTSELRDPQPILPDGCMEIVWNLGAPFRRLHPDGTSELQPRRMIVGQMDRAVAVAPTGRVDLVGVRFQPAGAHPLLGVSPASLRNELLPLGDVLALEDDLAPDQTLAERVRRIEERLRSRLGATRIDVELERVVRSVVALEGRVKIDALAFQMGVSPRQVARRFLAGVGLGPKRFARILRFQSTLRGATDDARAWAEVALDGGYYDQAHFIRDFKSFTGRSPEKFFAAESPLTRFFTRSRRTSDSYNTRASVSS